MQYRKYVYLVVSHYFTNLLTDVSNRCMEGRFVHHSVEVRCVNNGTTSEKKEKKKGKEKTAKVKRKKERKGKDEKDGREEKKEKRREEKRREEKRRSENRK